MTPKTLASETARQFRDRHGRAAEWLASAPGRVNLIGEHVDYNEGLVLPMAIDRHLVVAAARAENLRDSGFRISSSRYEDVVDWREGEPVPEAGHWSAYVVGVLTLCRAAGLKLPPLDLHIHGDLPAGAGLSSSAALEVATVTLAEAVCGSALTAGERIEICCEAEHRYAGVPCGIMDQSVVALARQDHLLLLDCRSRDFRHLPFDASEALVLVVNSGVRHELGESPYRERRRQCREGAEALGRSLRDVAAAELPRHRPDLSPVVYRRVRHVVTEIDRTREFAEAVTRRDWQRCGRLMYQSHASLRDDFEVSCPELDLLVQTASEIGETGGVYGARMTGGGFGGCIVALVARNAADEVAARIGAAYCTAAGRDAESLYSGACVGATLLPEDTWWTP